MKAATGELNLTVITIIAIAAIMGFFWLMWGNIKVTLNTQWSNISGNQPNQPAGMIVLQR